MRMMLKKKNLSLIADSTAEADNISKLKDGEYHEVTVKKIRNPKFHRKFFALVKLAHENSDYDMPLDSFRKYLVIKAGYFNVFPTQKGKYIEAKSIAFDKMDETEFAELYSKVLDVVVQEIGVPQETIENELIGFM